MVPLPSNVRLPEKSDHWNFLTSVSPSPDGKLQLVGSEADQARRISKTTGSSTGVLRTGSTSAAATKPNGRRIAPSATKFHYDHAK
jgi:hypothetical protein